MSTEGEVRDIVAGTVEGLLTQVVELVMDGWVISQSNPGEALMFSGGFVVTMERSKETVLAFSAKAETVGAAAKLTVQERMAKARAAIGKGKLDVNTVVEQ